MEKKVLTLAAARKMVAAAEAEAKRQHLAEDGGWPILIERMDHAAYVASVELAPGGGVPSPFLPSFDFLHKAVDRQIVLQVSGPTCAKNC